MLKVPSEPSRPKIHVQVFKDSLTCIVCKDKKLQLCNTYQYKTPEDFIYYILFCYEQLGLTTETDPITLSGHIAKADAVSALLFTSVRYINFESNSKGLQIKDTPEHQQFILSNL